MYINGTGSRAGVGLGQEIGFTLSLGLIRVREYSPTGASSFAQALGPKIGI